MLVLYCKQADLDPIISWDSALFCVVAASGRVGGKKIFYVNHNLIIFFSVNLMKASTLRITINIGIIQNFLTLSLGIEGN